MAASGCPHLSASEHFDEFDCLSSFVDKEICTDPQLQGRYKIRPNLSFSDPQAEKKFQKSLQAAENLNKSFGLALFHVVLHSVATLRDWYQYSNWYKHPQIMILLRMVVFAYAGFITVLFGISRCAKYPKLRLFVSANQHALMLSDLYVTGCFFSSLMFLYNPMIGLRWAPHATALFTVFALVRARWIYQVIGGVFQIAVFCIGAHLSGYDHSAISDSAIYLFLFGIIGLVGVFIMEHNARVLFANQEISLMIVQRHSRALKMWAQQEAQSNEAKSKFVANISHEIRTPLHGVITALDLLKGSGGMTPEQEDYVQVAETSSGLLLDILNNVLTISKLQAGKVALEAVPLDLRAIVDNVAAVFGQIAARKGVEVAAYVPPTCPVHLISDSVRLKQILFNLVSNAVKFTPKGSVQIHVQAEESTETENEVTLTVRVKDSGIGVAKEHLHLLFQRFSQVDESSTRRFQGTGLGLALVFEFANLFRGTVKVQSEGLEKGTSFSFSARFVKDANSPVISDPISDAPRGTNSDSRPSFVSFQSRPSGDHDHRISAPSPIAIKFVSLVFHPLPEVAEICSNYLKHFGFDSAVASPYGDLASLSQSVNERLSTSDPDVCVPLCIAIDHSLIHDPQAILTLQTLCSDPWRRRQSSDAGWHPHPLLFLVLEDPAHTGEMTYHISGVLQGKNVWSIKKPVRMQRLEEIISAMRSYLRTEMERSKNRILAPNSPHLRSLLRKRRQSAPENRFGQGTLLNCSGGQDMEEESDFGHHSSQRLSRAGVSTLENMPFSRRTPRKQSMDAPPSFLQESFDQLQEEASSEYSDLLKFKFGGGSSDHPADPLPAVVQPTPSSNTQQGSHSDLSSTSFPMPESRILQLIISDQPPTAAPANRSPPSRPPSCALSPMTPRPTAGDSKTQGDSQPVSDNIPNHKRVLIADDNAINRKLTERLLTKAGFHCTCVEDGAQAVDAATLEQFSVIFMDITMPVMDGCTATRLIQQRQGRVPTSTLICALSAAESERFTADFDAVLPKPVKSADLIETASALSERWQKQVASI